MKSSPLSMSANALKLLAAVSMTVDHVGFILFPRLQILRIIGRLAFPIFAYFIYVGCRHTHDPRRYLLTLALLGLVMSAVQYFATGLLYGNVLITFALSVSLIFLIRRFLDKGETWAGLAAIALTEAVYLLCRAAEIDYGFWGVLLPVLTHLSGRLKPIGRFKRTELIGFAAGLILLALSLGREQPYSLAALFPLCLYNGKKGFRLPKYAFYVFYPAHIVIIWLISLLPCFA